MTSKLVEVGYVHQTYLGNNFIITFSLFQLESKSHRTKQCWPCLGLLHSIVFGNFLCIKNLHFEPFNYTIKSICFDFGSTNVGSSVIKTLKKIIITIFWLPKSELDLVPIQKFLCCRSQTVLCCSKCFEADQKWNCI